MSSTLRSFADLPRHSSLQDDMADLTLPPLSNYHHRYHQSYSPPLPSSSPPRTPYSTRQSYDHAHIRSSPRMADFQTTSDYYEDSRVFLHPPLPNKQFFPVIPPHTSRAHYVGKGRTSDLNASVFSDNISVNSRFGKGLSRTTSCRSASTSSDSEEQGEETGFSFSDLGIHIVSFRTSEERGRWKTDPIPYQSKSRLSIRKSAPAADSASDVLVTSRPASEPALSKSAAGYSRLPKETNKQSDTRMPEVTSASSPVTHPFFPTSPTLDSVETLPPLTSDRDSSMDPDEILTPSSPLPPSSPPISPALSVAPLPETSDDLHFSAPSSPLVAPSSPLSPISSEIGEEDARDIVVAVALAPVVDEQEQDLDLDESDPTPNPGQSPRPHDLLAHPSESTSIKLDLPTSEPQVTKPSVHDLPSESTFEDVTKASQFVPTPLTTSHSIPISPIDERVFANNTGESSCNIIPSDDVPQLVTPKQPREAKLDTIKENIVPVSSYLKGAPKGIDNAATSKKRFKRKMQPRTNDDAPRKRSKPCYDTDASSSKTVVKKQRKTRKKQTPLSDEETDYSGSSRASSVTPEPAFSDDQHDRNGITLEDAEVCGMIIEGMATSRASSLPISHIYRIVMENRPSLKAERSEQEWNVVFERILQSGMSGRGSGVFGKVDSSYKDDNDHGMEARWFYVPEQDRDRERAALIRSMMPRPGKRSVTKKYKQYYYQPLDKISRWDPEDDL